MSATQEEKALAEIPEPFEYGSDVIFAELKFAMEQPHCCADWDSEADHYVFHRRDIQTSETMYDTFCDYCKQVKAPLSSCRADEYRYDEKTKEHRYIKEVTICEDCFDSDFSETSPDRKYDQCKGIDLGSMAPVMFLGKQVCPFYEVRNTLCHIQRCCTWVKRKTTVLTKRARDENKENIPPYKKAKVQV